MTIFVPRISKLTSHWRSFPTNLEVWSTQDSQYLIFPQHTMASSSAILPSNHNPQLQSSLLRMPQEVRDRIFEHAFSSTRLSYGNRLTSDGFRCPVKPQPNALALLYVCKRTNLEIGNQWLKHVLFNYEDPATLLNQFADLPPSISGLIRHIRVSNVPFRFICHRPEENDSPQAAVLRGQLWQLDSALSLLQGLRLDTLTVLGCGNPSFDYDTLRNLVRNGNGWKELRFLAPTSEMLTPQFQQRGYLREPQPITWRREMEKRDDASTQPVVEIYRSTALQLPPAEAQQPVSGQGDEIALTTRLEPVLEPVLRIPNTSGSRHHVSASRGGFSSTILKPSRRERFELPASLSLLKDHSLHVQWTQLQPWSSDETLKEMMIVIRRGKNCLYEVKEVEDIWEVPEDDAHLYLRQLKTWRSARQTYAIELYTLPVRNRGNKQGPGVIDQFEHADDHEWSLITPWSIRLPWTGRTWAYVDCFEVRSFILSLMMMIFNAMISGLTT